MVWRLKNIETGQVHEYTSRDRVKRMLAERDGTPVPDGMGGVHYPNPKFKLVGGDNPFNEPVVPVAETASRTGGVTVTLEGPPADEPEATAVTDKLPEPEAKAEAAPEPETKPKKGKRKKAK